MPVLAYKCEVCNHQFTEFYHKFTEELPACPMCKNKTKRVLTKPAENPFGSISWFKFS